MKKIFIVHSRKNKTNEQYATENEKIVNRIQKRFPNEELYILDNEISNDDLPNLAFYISVLAQADLVVFEPKYLYNEGTVVKLCCDLYSIPHINLPPNTYTYEME